MALTDNYANLMLRHLRSILQGHVHWVLLNKVLLEGRLRLNINVYLGTRVSEERLATKLSPLLGVHIHNLHVLSLSKLSGTVLCWRKAAS